MSEPKTKAEAMNEAQQAKERADLCDTLANAKGRRHAKQRIELRNLAETNRKQHARYLALAATLPE